MSVLETVTVNNVTYDMHDPKVGSGTLSTTAQTLIPAVNEVKSGLTTVSGKTDVIGSGSLNTTSQTLVGAINELVSSSATIITGQNTFPEVPYGTTKTQELGTPKKDGTAVLLIASDYIYADDWGESTSKRNWVSGATVLSRKSDTFGTLLFLSVTAGQTVYFRRYGNNTNLSTAAYLYFLIA